MKKQITYLIIFILLIVVGALFYFWPANIQAQEEEEEDTCDPASVTVIARDPDGNFIPNIYFEIYEQTVDVDGKPKPGSKVGSGRISPTLGKGVDTFTPDEDHNGIYALKMWDQNKNVGAFYFYNDIQVGCGSSTTVTEVLGGIKIILRDTEGNLRKNTKFWVYTQRLDADGQPIKEKQDLVKSLNSSEEGEFTLYVADDTRSIGGEGSDYYVLEAEGKDRDKFILYDINVDAERTTEVEYVFSDAKIVLKDANGTVFPANSKIEIYEQEIDSNNNYALGDHIKNIYTDDKGTAIFEYPAGIYAVRVEGANDQYHYFWNTLQVVDQTRQNYTLRTEDEWDPGQGACEADSIFTVVVKGKDSQYIPDAKVELYEQVVDSNGNPAAGDKIFREETNDYGEAVKVFNPDPRKEYALKIYISNAEVGDFWFFDQIKFTCGEDKELVKGLPAINIILRDGGGNLKKNQKFSIYTQQFDADGNPIKERKDLVSSSFTTSEEGAAAVYVAPDHPYIKSKRGTYVFSAIGENGAEFIGYDIVVPGDKHINYHYTFSDIVLEVKNAGGQPIVDREVKFYKQTENLSGGYALGNQLKSYNTDDNGRVRFEYPAGNYAAVIKDDINQDNIFWNAQITDRQRVNKTLTTNLTKINVKDQAGEIKPKGTRVEIYSMTESGQNNFYKDKKLKSVTIAENGFAEIVLKPDAYLLTTSESKKEYGKAFYAENGKLQNITINTNPDFEITTGQRFYVVKPVSPTPPSTPTPPSGSNLAERLKGYILLQVQEHGEAWYVDIDTKLRYYMRNGYVAYNMMREFGLGITNADLEKIPIGFDARFNEVDSDGDQLSDKMEEALGTNKFNKDSDGDGYNDDVEVSHDYNPSGGGKLPIDLNLTNRLKGRILLQVQSRGEAWYLNPQDGRRYYMQDGDMAYEIMRFLSLGITNADLANIEEGYLSGY